VGNGSVNWRNVMAIAVKGSPWWARSNGGAVEARVGAASSFGCVGLTKYPSKEYQTSRHKKVCRSSRIGCNLAKIGVPSSPKLLHV
jgi:hypothetical protein